MKTKKLYLLWLGIYVLCAGLGLIPQRNLFFQILLTVLALAFYIPGVLLLCRGITEGSQKLIRQIRWISLASLLLTLLLFIFNVLAVRAAQGVGVVLNILLNLVSVPMYCCYWPGLGLFLWACLFIGSFPRLWKK